MTILNGKIRKTMLGTKDFGFFTFLLDITFDGTGCGYGTYALDEYDKDKKKRVPTDVGLGAIIKLLETLELNSWEELENTFVRCEIENNSIVRIGHLIKDKWFSFPEYYEENNKTDTNIDINWNYRLRDINTELHKALHELVVENVEYMILNSLGDPYKKQTINNAITAMDKNTELFLSTWVKTLEYVNESMNN